MRGPDRLGDSRGQVVPLFALGLIALLAVVALAIDVSNVYAARRFYRAVADGSSLAGAQDLQNTARSVSNSDRNRARDHALQVLIDRLGASGAPSPAVCPTTANLVDCVLPGTPFRISIKTPSPTCVACDPDHAVQVTLHNPTFNLSFARVVGFRTWDVGITSVAGLTFSTKYALVTLRPPNPLPNGLDQNRQDINVNGNNTVLNILQGDVGTNTSAYTNSGGRIILVPSYFIYHLDDIVPDPWNKDLAGNPRGRLLTRLVPDPNYVYPTRTAPAPPTFASQVAGEDSTCAGAPTLPADALPAGAKCYRPGIYAQNFNVLGGNVAYLEPGAYFFDAGLDIRGQLLGGLISNARGVVVVVPKDRTFTANNAQKLWLNKGGSACSDDGCRALPALDAAGTEIKTTQGLVLSIEVVRDSACFNVATPRLCSDNGNRAINLPGNGQMYVSGVIYGPSDQMQINGDGTVQTGTVGQIISWTVSYSGGAQLSQSYPGGEEIGILRLDAACTTSATPCNP